MNLYQLFLTKNDCYISGRKMTPKGIMVHSTGAPNPNLKRYVGPDDGRLGKNTYNNHWNQSRPSGRQICCHAFIGKLADGTIATYQTLPWTMRGWHCAKGSNGSGNDYLIGFEVCEDDLNNKVYFEAVYKEAVELCAFLCNKYDLNADTVIDHAEGYRRGIASNHGDITHWLKLYGLTMKDFRASVQKCMTSDATASQPAKKSKRSMSAAQQSFIDQVGKAAQADSNILPSLTIAQAILESGWGKSDLAQKANALFGIKANADWTGPRVDRKTYEYVNAERVDTTAAFRAYQSWGESLANHNAFLRGSKRYKAVVGERDYKKACHAIHSAGYATDPEYANKLIKLIEQYDLTQWDSAPVLTEHTVKQGDTLWSLAVRYLGNGQRWTEIQKLNGGIDPTKLRIGMILKIKSEERE